MTDTPADCGTFIIIWIGFTVLMIVGISLVFLWGVRSRQFENQDRARHLALWSGIPEDDPADDDNDDDDPFLPPAKGTDKEDRRK